jgi:hypothetical protein
MPKPPAGFVLDDQGRCIAAASKRIVTIVRLPIPFLSFFFLSFVLHLVMVGFCSYFFLSSQMKLSTTQLKPNQHCALQIDDTSNRPLECIIRRVFRSSQDHDCLLLCPVDM